jgi:hypothetical protein
MIIGNSYKLIGGIILIGVLLLLGWVAWDKSAPGALIAGFAGIWGALKANLFGGSKEDIKEEHTKKRSDWVVIKSRFDQQVEQLNERMEHLDYRSQQVTERLKKLDVIENAKIKSVKNMSAQEKARLLDRLI